MAKVIEMQGCEVRHECKALRYLQKLPCYILLMKAILSLKCKGYYIIEKKVVSASAADQRIGFSNNENIIDQSCII